MVKCDACTLANDVRYVRPPGICELCQIITPYQDRLCASCSDAAQRCQSCRSKRVHALISVPAATQPVLAALAQQQRQPPHSARRASPSPTRRSNVDRSLHSQEGMHESFPSEGRSSYVASSPFHFANRTTYSLDDLEPERERLEQQHLSQTMPSPTPTNDQQQQLVLHDSPRSDDDDKRVAVRPAAMLISPDMSQPLHGDVILSPSGKLLPATLDPLSPRMAVRQNALGVAPQVRGQSDAQDVVSSWTRPELVHNIFHYYCNYQATKLSSLMTLGKFRSFALDAGIVSSSQDAASPSLSSNRLDILFTQCTRPLSGSRIKMNEEQFFEALGALALWKYGGGAVPLGGKLSSQARAPSKLVPALEKLFDNHLSPLARNIVRARSGGMGLRSEEWDPVVTSLFLKYEDSLRRIFTRLVRENYPDLPRAEEQLSHPLLEEGWRSFCKGYGFFPEHISAPSLLRLFVGTSTGMTRTGNLEQAAMSFDDFMHALFQLAQISFTLTPHAVPVERVELLLHKIDSVRRELNFMPIAHKSGMGARNVLGAGPNAQGQMVVHGVQSNEEMRERLVAALPSPRDDQAFSGVQSLFSEGDMSCARDLFNLYCNTASQSSYSEVLPRIQFVRMLRESGVVDGRRLAAADPDLLFNGVLAGAVQASMSTATAFARGRHMTFHLFLLGLVEAASRAWPKRAAMHALRSFFAEHLDPLLARRIARLQEEQSSIHLPLGAGINSSGSPMSPGTWGAGQAWGGPSATAAAAAAQGRLGPGEEKQGEPNGKLPSSSPDATAAATPLYPNHPASHIASLPDIPALMSQDPGVRALFSTYNKVLSKAFFNASWSGVEAQHGVAIPRLGSSLALSSPAASPTAGAAQRSWDLFLQSKSLLSEHAFRRWLSLCKIVPELVAHKQVTMLFREGGVGFDRIQDEFVLNMDEFKETLLRIALLAFAGPAYSQYRTPASKLELLFFVADQNTAGGFHFRGFNHLPHEVSNSATISAAAVKHSESDAALIAGASNLGRAYWERTHASELGVKALLEQEAQRERSQAQQQQQHHDEDSDDDEYGAAASARASPARPLMLPQDGTGHGARSHTAVTTAPNPSVLPLKGFNTSTAVPRVPFATTVLEPFQPAQHGVASHALPSRSPTKKLFQQTPFFSDQSRKATKFSANVPAFASQPLKSPRGAAKSLR